MDKLGLGIRGGAVADIGAPCLEIAAVGAGAYLQPLGAAGRPDLNIIGLGGGETEVGGAELQDAVGQSQLLADLFGIMDQLFQFLVRGGRLGELVKLHLSNWWPRLMPRVSLPGGHLFPAEAGGVGDII